MTERPDRLPVPQREALLALLRDELGRVYAAAREAGVPVGTLDGAIAERIAALDAADSADEHRDGDGIM